MKFKCEHHFAGLTQAQYEELYFDEDFNIALCKEVGLARTLLRRDVTAGKLRREVKVGADREIPPTVAKILGANRIEYTETIDYTFGTFRGTWSTLSSLMTEKVDSRGTFAFGASGGGVTRTIEGDVTVKITLVGGMIEKFIVADVEKSYEKAAEFTRRWLASHPR